MSKSGGEARPKRLPFKLIALMLLGTGGGLTAIELVLRAHPPRPTTQIIRNNNGVPNHVRLLNGTPIWGAQERENRACLDRYPKAPSIIFLGDSILYGAGVDDDEVFSALLDVELNKGRGELGTCVVNLAQAGFGFDQSYVTAEAALAGRHPTIVFWELWGEQRDYRLLGEDAYDVGGMRLRSDGFPSPTLAALLPDALNRTLFLHSRLYEFAALAYGSRIPPRTPAEDFLAFRDDRLARVGRLVQAAGGHLVFVIGTPLDKPFEELQSDSRHEAVESAAKEIAQRFGGEVVRLQDLLVGQDYREVRLDECCHFNPVGHRALAAAFLKLSRPLIEPKVATPQP